MDRTFFTLTPFLIRDTHKALTYHTEEFLALNNCTLVITRTSRTDATALLILDYLFLFFQWKVFEFLRKSFKSVHRDPSIDCYNCFRINLSIYFWGGRGIVHMMNLLYFSFLKINDI